MNRGIWNTLELLAETHPPAAVLAEWRQLASADFAALKRFLSATQRRAQNYPCLGERDCGCRHEVDPTELFSVCQCEDGGCEAVKLTPEEIIIHELDAPRFGDAVGGALGFEAADGSGVSTAAPKVWPAGIHAGTRSPVYLALCPGETELLKNLEGVAAFCGEPFIVLSPTARVRSATVSAFLQREHCAFVPLASCLAPNNGGFRATSSIRPILERFAAEVVVTVAGPRAIGTKARPASGSHGRMRWENDFDDIWVGGVHYDLRGRNTARFCIQFLVERKAFAKSSARHLENEIDPYVRKHAKLPALSASADGNLRIQRYFNDPEKKYNDLRKELVKAAGRNGCFYLQVI